MKQKWRDPTTGKNHWVGDRDDVAELLGEDQAWGQTFAKYSRARWPKFNPAPRPVAVDFDTRRDLWILDDCLAWQRRRLGPGRVVRA